MTRVVVALDSFKGSISAAAASRAFSEGWRSVEPDASVVARPMADGGEGTLDAFAVAVDAAERIPVLVSGPDGELRDAAWLRLPGSPVTAVVELASTSGIELLRDGLRPWDADTTGFGQAIRAALAAGAERLVLGIGSSASTDGGSGLLRVLGASFTSAAGGATVAGARGLADIARADLSGLVPLPAAGVVVLTDVTNPLLGDRGAAAVFGPQKGLDAVGVASVDAALARYAALLPADPSEPGTGAAGGAGYALRAWGARLVPGAPEVAELIRLEEAVASADLVVTGEGSFDGQSAAGKVPSFVAELASHHGVPVALVAGRIAPDADTSAFAASLSLTTLAGSPAASLATPALWLRAAATHLARTR